MEKAFIIPLFPQWSNNLKRKTWLSKIIQEPKRVRQLKKNKAKRRERRNNKERIKKKHKFNKKKKYNLKKIFNYQMMEEKQSAYVLKVIQFLLLLLSQMEDTTMILLTWPAFNIEFLPWRLTELSISLILVKENILKWSLKQLKKPDG